MKLLAIDCATSVLVAGVCSDDGAVDVAVEVPSKNHAPTLLATVERVLGQARLSLCDIDGIAVGVGPGSFTGVRIGVATAKALAFALGKPVWGVSTIEALARRRVGGRVVASVASRAGEVFAAAYDADRLVLAQCAMSVGALEEWARGHGPAAWARIGVGSERVAPAARDIAALGFARARMESGGDGDSLAPVYVAAPPVKATSRSG